MGRPPLEIGTWGRISRKEITPGVWVAHARYRDAAGKIRHARKQTPAGVRDRVGAAAERALLTNLAALVAHTTSSDLNLSTRLSALAEQWIALNALGDMTADTQRRYELTWRNKLAPAMGAWTLHEATTGRIDKVLLAIARDSPSNAILARIVLRGMFTIAVRHDVLRINPVLGAAVIPPPRKPIRALTVEELQKLRANVALWDATHPRGNMLDFVDLMLATGFRIGEMLSVRWSDVDLEAHTITLSGPVKTETSRRKVTVPRFGAEILLRLRINSASEWVLPSVRGTQRDPDNLRTQFREARGKEFKWVSPHVFRKTVATLLAREHSIEAAASQLGHADGGKTAARHYVQRVHEAPDLSALLQKLAHSGENAQ